MIPNAAATARAEIDFLTTQLATAYGLGRRARKGADTNEKVRKAVTKCLRTSLASIQKAHLPLWRHHAALKTGTFCSYTLNRRFSGKCSRGLVSPPAPAALPAPHPSLRTLSRRTLVQAVPAHGAFATAQVAVRLRK